MRSFAIVPFEGAGFLRFGTSPAEVRRILGRPVTSNVSRNGEPYDWYDFLTATYDRETGMLCEIALSPESDVRFQGVDVFRDPNALKALAANDSQPVTDLGFVVFPRLGIVLADFLSDQRSDRVVIVHGRGRWTDLDRFRPFDVDSADLARKDAER